MAETVITEPAVPGDVDPSDDVGNSLRRRLGLTATLANPKAGDELSVIGMPTGISVESE